MIASPADVHAHIAAGAADAATLLAVHTEASPVCSIVVEYDHERGAPRVACQLAALGVNALDALVSWLDVLDEPSVSVTRYDQPTPFTSVSVHAATGETAVRVWAHPGEDDRAALFSAAGHEPEPGVTAALSVSTLRAAALTAPVAESAEAADDTDHDPSANTATEDEGAA